MFFRVLLSATAVPARPFVTLALWGVFPFACCRLRNTMTALEGAAAPLDVPPTLSLRPSLAAQALRPFLFGLQGSLVILLLAF
jgi:hypothetical protein